MTHRGALSLPSPEEALTCLLWLQRGASYLGGGLARPRGVATDPTGCARHRPPGLECCLWRAGGRRSWPPGQTLARAKPCPRVSHPQHLYRLARRETDLEPVSWSHACHTY